MLIRLPNAETERAAGDSKNKRFREFLERALRRVESANQGARLHNSNCLLHKAIQKAHRSAVNLHLREAAHQGLSPASRQHD